MSGVLPRGMAHLRAWELGAKLLSWRDGGAPPDCSRQAAYIFLALFAPALAAILLANSKFNWINNDAVFLFSSLEKLERFSSLFSNANANPLQALFDILPSGLRLGAIPNIIGQVFGPGIHVDFFLICSGLMLAYAVTAMARAGGMGWGVAVLAGFLVALLLLPTFGMFPLGDHMYVLWPITYYVTAGAVLVTALLWQIDGQSPRRSALLTAAIVIVLLHLSIINVMFATLWAPATLALGVGALAASTTRKEVLAKILCAAAVVGALACVGIFHYLYALGINTARHVFFQELMDFMNFFCAGLEYHPGRYRACYNESI